MKKTKCQWCRYEWFCKSKMLWITCPNCQKKTKRTVREARE